MVFFCQRHQKTYKAEKKRRCITSGILFTGITVFPLMLEKLPESIAAMNRQHIFQLCYVLIYGQRLIPLLVPTVEARSGSEGTGNRRAPWWTSDRWGCNCSRCTLTPALLSSRVGIIGQSGIQQK